MIGARAGVRVGLIFLAVVQLFVGAWMLLLPHSFYRTVPTVAAYPPFNEHLLRDLGSLYLALAVVLGVSAIVMAPSLVYTALGAYLVLALPHLVFHVTHLAGLSVAEATVLTSALAVLAIVPTALLLLGRGLAGEVRAARKSPGRRTEK